jgi:hypothetical protein
MTKYRGTLVRTRSKHGYNWSPEYLGQVFLVTDVFVNDEGRWTYQLLDHIKGGFICASPLEVKRIAGSEGKAGRTRRPREGGPPSKVLGCGGHSRVRGNRAKNDS